MSVRITLATTGRVLAQLRRDPRTLAMIVVVPCILIALVKWMFDGDEATFQRVGVPLLGIFPLISMFLITSIAMLRERTSGTLERLMSLPVGRFDLLLGYGLAFGVTAVVQAGVVSLVGFGFLGLDVAGSMGLVIALAVANAILGTALGLFVSAFASTEFQAVQFMPAIILPQLFLCGLLVPRAQMASALDWLSGVLPMTYAYDGLARVASDQAGARLLVDVLVVLGATVLALGLGAATLRRRTA
jgi:ABC-2 type transport system permease protein